MNDAYGDNEKPVVVLDNGSITIKAGCSGDDAPKVYLENRIGHPMHASEFAPDALWPGRQAVELGAFLGQ